MSFFIYALKHGASQDPNNRDGEQLGLIRLCGQCSAWHIPIIGITPMHLLEGMSKKRHPHALRNVSFMYNPGAPFGLESFDLEAIRLRATRHELVDMSHGRGALDRLMAERKRRGQLLKCYIFILVP
jgi:hypothetical protein